MKQTIYQANEPQLGHIGKHPGWCLRLRNLFYLRKITELLRKEKRHSLEIERRKQNGLEKGIKNHRFPSVLDGERWVTPLWTSLPTETDGWSTHIYKQDMTHRFRSKGWISTSIRHFPMSEYETDSVIYNTHCSMLNSISTSSGADADIFWSLMTPKLNNSRCNSPLDNFRCPWWTMR